jgi:4-hydroxy-tetrahydrodipicolinate reductase
MGRLVCRAVADDPDLVLVAGISPTLAGERLGKLIARSDVDVTISDELDTLLQAEAEVAVDFTTPAVVMDDVRWAVEHGIHIVVGTTGIGPAELAEIAALLEADGESNVIVAPNFAIGAVLLQRFAAQAARFFPAAEIIELHHDGKADAPSGTAIATAHRIAAERGEAASGEPQEEAVAGVRGGAVEGIRVHSVRLPGLVAHQEVILGGRGQTLTIRHDSMDRSSFMPGVLLAVRRIASLPGLTVGLEPLLDLPGFG